MAYDTLNYLYAFKNLTKAPTKHPINLDITLFGINIAYKVYRFKR